MNVSSYELELKQFFMRRGLITAREACAELRLSQPAVARLITSMGDQILVLGKARSTRYALKREIRNLGTQFSIHHVAKDGSVSHLADLIPLHPKGFFVVSRSANIFSAYYDDLPWWLDDLRPSGFLGRTITRRHPEIGYPKDVRLWRTDDCLHYWSTLGWDLIGNLIIGERAFETYTSFGASLPYMVDHSARAARYQEMATQILTQGTAGSSAAGEQPKFLAFKAPSNVNVLVKFSPEGSAPPAKRRAELLICEHIALEVLRRAGIDAPRSELILGKSRTFLEVERFDRVGRIGRRGLVSLNALDMQFTAQAGSWREISRELSIKRIVAQEMYEKIVWRYYFGVCIGNSDMHAGNLSFYIDGEELLDLAPVYDMLPMIYAPVHEEIAPLIFIPPVLLPNERIIWEKVLPVAITFWHEVRKEKKLTHDWREIAAQWIGWLERLN